TGLASHTLPPFAIFTAAATEKIGKSYAPRRRSFHCVLFQPSFLGSATSVGISPGLRLRYSLPSLRYRSSSATSRSPSAETSRSFAPSEISAGAVSVDETARQRLEAVATQQIEPSIFMQKSIALRHS